MIVIDHLKPNDHDNKTICEVIFDLLNCATRLAYKSLKRKEDSRILLTYMTKWKYLDGIPDQTDDYNCGPIMCIDLLNIMERLWRKETFSLENLSMWIRTPYEGSKTTDVCRKF